MIFCLLPGIPQITEIEVAETPIVGSMLSVKCKATGDPAPTIKWLFNGKPTDDQGFMARQDTLIGLGLTMKQEGIYRCEATNHYGTIFKEKMIKIRSKN